MDKQARKEDMYTVKLSPPTPKERQAHQRSGSITRAGRSAQEQALLGLLVTEPKCVRAANETLYRESGSETPELTV